MKNTNNEINIATNTNTLNTDNTFSVHTVKFGRKLSYKEYAFLNVTLTDYARTYNCNIYSDKNNEFLNFHMFRNDYGINTITLQVYTTTLPDKSMTVIPVFYIYLTINLRKFFNVNEHPFICIVPANLIADTLKSLDSFFKYLEVDTILKSEELFINRIDFCTNFKCESEVVKDALLRIARKGRSPKKSYIKTIYSEKGKREIQPTNSFTIKSNANSYEFTIYDKHSELTSSDFGYDDDEIKLSENQLRVEFRIKNTFVNRLKKTNKLSILDFMCSTADFSKQYIEKYIEQIYPASEIFYRYDIAKNMIENSNHNKTTKTQMLFLLKLTATSGLNKASEIYKESFDNYHYIIRCFRDLALCPITLSNRSTFDSLPGFIHYIYNCNSNNL